MSEEYSPENVKVFIGDKEVTGWQDISYPEQWKPLKGMEFPVECELYEEDMQKTMEDLRVSIYNSEVGE
jgi:hypothetical protein